MTVMNRPAVTAVELKQLVSGNVASWMAKQTETDRQTDGLTDRQMHIRMQCNVLSHVQTDY